MTERSLTILDLLRKDEKITWVVDQLVQSFAEGVAESAKQEVGIAVLDQGPLTIAPISQRERTKRNKYETSRPYTEGEKLALEEFALTQIFSALPAMQETTARVLSELGSKANSVELVPPDEEEREDRSYAYHLETSSSKRSELASRLKKFLVVLGNDNN